MAPPSVSASELGLGDIQMNESPMSNACVELVASIRGQIVVVSDGEKVFV